MQHDRPDGHWINVGDVNAVHGRVYPQEAAILQCAAATQRSGVQLLDACGQLLQEQQTPELHGASHGTGSDNIAM